MKKALSLKSGYVSSEIMIIMITEEFITDVEEKYMTTTAPRQQQKGRNGRTLS